MNKTDIYAVGGIRTGGKRPNLPNRLKGGAYGAARVMPPIPSKTKQHILILLGEDVHPAGEIVNRGISARRGFANHSRSARVSNRSNHVL